MSVILMVPYLPAGRTDLKAYLTREINTQANANPAGYGLVDLSSDGRYTALIPTYQSQQPLGRYWMQLKYDGDPDPIYADWVVLAEGIAQAGEVNLQPIREILESDDFFDTTVTPWEYVRRKKGTNVEISRQQLFDHHGDPIVRISTFVGKRLTPTTTPTPTTTAAPTTTHA